MATLTVTIELSEEEAASVSAAAAARGVDMNTYATAAVVGLAADEAAELDEVVAACKTSIEDIKAGRTFTLEEADARLEADLAAARVRLRERNAG